MEKELAQKSTQTASKKAQAKKKPAGLHVERYFTTPGVDPADELAWEYRAASIQGEDGKAVFEQKNIEVPKSWSMLATNVVASKYFRGTPGTPERETSVRKLVAWTPSPAGASRAATSSRTTTARRSTRS